MKNFIRRLFARKEREDTSTCPVCLGDGRGEGWKTAFPCTACGGDGHYHNNEESNREIRRNASEMENERMKKSLPYDEYQEWLNKKYKIPKGE